VWAQEAPERLGPRTRGLLVNAAHLNHVCTISTLEIARLVATGAVELSLALRDWVDRSLAALQARSVAVSHAIAMEAYALPEPFHKDPADRLLVGAARCHELVVLTADERILSYGGVRTKDARA
jgi:PIN domain nuclease of toxin-antitoxin system